MKWTKEIKTAGYYWVIRDNPLFEPYPELVCIIGYDESLIGGRIGYEMYSTHISRAGEVVVKRDDMYFYGPIEPPKFEKGEG